MNAHLWQLCYFFYQMPEAHVFGYIETYLQDYVGEKRQRRRVYEPGARRLRMLS